MSDQAVLMTEEIDRLLDEGKRIAATIPVAAAPISAKRPTSSASFREHVVRPIGHSEWPE